MGPKIFRYLQILTQILIFVVLLSGAVRCFTTYAIVISHEKYEKAEYSQKEVRAIAFEERDSGIIFAYSANIQHLKYTYLPLFILLIANMVLGYVSKRSAKQT